MFVIDGAVVRMIIRSLEMVLKCFVKRWRELEIRGSDKIVQMTALFKSFGILRRLME